MAARHKKPKTPVAKPPTAKPWAHAYNKRLQALHTAWAEHVIDACKAALGERTDEFDPDEPRDEHGQWTAGAVAGRQRHARARLRAATAELAKNPTEKNARLVAFHTREVARVAARKGAAPKPSAKAIERKHAELQARVSEARGNFERAKSVERGLIIRPETILTSPYRERVLKRHEARLARFREKHGLRADSITDDLLAEFRPLIDALGLSKFLRRMGNSITRAQANYIKRVARVPISGVAPPDKLEAWRQENLSLIRSLNAEQIQTVGDIIRPAQAQGLRWEDVSDQIQDALGVGSNRAKLIARDQTNKWNGAMMQQTQSDAGITQYRWSTSRDLAVRGRPDGVYPKSKENHWDLEGTIHSWDNPPVIPGTNVRSHPGGRIQCRCTATPVVPWLDALA